MKIISVHCKQNAIRSEDAQIFSALTDTGIAMSFLTFLRTGDMHVRFDGASLTNVDAGRNVGSAAVGAVAGGLLLGPLGALAGGALGGRKSHTLVLNSPDARVVFEASTNEFQRLLGCGMPSDERIEIQAERLPEMKLRWWVIPATVLASIFVLVAVLRPKDAKTASAVPEAAATTADVRAKAPAQPSAKASKPASKQSAKAPSTKSTAKVPPPKAPAKAPAKSPQQPTTVRTTASNP